jgi:TRAP-type C4-dicarboxylate transport system permease small subunit
MKKLYENVIKYEVRAAMACLAVLSALVLYSAVTRTIGHPVKWAVDAATFLFAWCVFLGSDAAMRHDKLFAIEVITGRLPPKMQLWLKIINYLIIVAFLAFLIVFGIILSYDTRMRTFQGIPGFSYTWVTISVPLGCLLMLTTAILKIRQLLKAGHGNTRSAAGGKELL